ncbi:hypothetical protein BN1088_1580001 [Sphingobacterium sp. PM2-P1-29]|nr:hypothetical protein BN1088_1580001 [Sphingobacterium sp. PM2-P1-29]
MINNVKNIFIGCKYINFIYNYKLSETHSKNYEKEINIVFGDNNQCASCPTECGAKI